MDIVRVEYDEELELTVRGHKVTIRFWPTQEPGNFKIGVSAPRALRVNREESVPRGY